MDKCDGIWYLTWNENLNGMESEIQTRMNEFGYIWIDNYKNWYSKVVPGRNL